MRVCWSVSGMLAVAAALLLPSRSDAAIVPLGTTLSASAPDLSVVLPSYPVIQAINFGGPAVVRNGISFAAGGLPGSDKPATIASTPFTVLMDADGNLAVDDIGGGADSLFLTEIWVQGGNSQALTIAGLNPGATYQIYLLHADTRGNVPSYFPKNQNFIEESGSLSDGSTSLEFGTLFGSYAVQGVEVTGTSFFSTEMLRSNRGPSYAGVVIMQVPEPGTGILLASMGLALFARFRRR